MQHQDHFFKETNTLTMKETISLAHFLEFQISESEQPIIEFYFRPTLGKKIYTIEFFLN